MTHDLTVLYSACIVTSRSVVLTFVTLRYAATPLSSFVWQNNRHSWTAYRAGCDTRRTVGQIQMKIKIGVLGHSLVRSLLHLLVCSHRSLVRLLRTAHFAHSLARGTVYDSFSVFFYILAHSAIYIWLCVATHPALFDCIFGRM